MEKEIPQKNIKRLSTKQQIGLYTILNKLRDEKNHPFLSSDFAREMQVLLLISNPAEYQQTIGGILGALSKNSLIEKISGDKDPLWVLPEYIHKNAEKYKKELFPVITYWQK
ncbi:MAG: hypothetical protein Q8R36_02005 [bacterium]|nr:hypothetical protein [bacterium]